jgi:UDP-N-acetylglucosamine pyrophosphorylase
MVQMLASGGKTKNFETCKMLIMTSMINHQDTVKYFEDNNYFGASQESLVFFP